MIRNDRQYFFGYTKKFTRRLKTLGEIDSRLRKNPFNNSLKQQNKILFNKLLKSYMKFWKAIDI